MRVLKVEGFGGNTESIQSLSLLVASTQVSFFRSFLTARGIVFKIQLQHTEF